VLDLGIEVEGTLIGDIQARQPRNAIPAGVFELGIEIYESGHHGKGYGGEATRMLTGWLFERAGAERVQAETAVGNIGMRRVLERLGYSFEGVMRGFMAGPSGREDYALYAATRSDWVGWRDREISEARRESRKQS
jgi:RimJ/RimL family protein N-acetyltransferase